jgi:hypothetical protein
MDDEVLDILNRVKCCVDDCELRVSLGLIPHGSTKRMIFRGSYDVWETAADGAIYDKIMNDRLNKVRDLGLILNESGQNDWREGENWTLTAAGEIYYGQRTRGKTCHES